MSENLSGFRVEEDNGAKDDGWIVSIVKQGCPSHELCSFHLDEWIVPRAPVPRHVADDGADFVSR